MKSVVKLTLLSAVLCFTALSTVAQTPTPKSTSAAPSAGADIPTAKIAIINTAAFAENISELKGRYETLATEFSPRRTEIESMKSAMDAKQKQLDDNGSKMTPVQVRKLQDEIEQLKREGTRKLEDYQNDLTKREDALTGSTYSKINEFLMKYTTERNITIVWNYAKIYELGVILYIDPKADITADFITAYNKANPATTAQNATDAKKP